jgi:hypothetical protein
LTSRVLREGIALALVLACALTPRIALAQHRGERERAGAPADTGAFFPTWMHPWLELGGDWLAGPKYMQHPYKSGEAIAAGIAVRPRRHLELRAALDYESIEVENDRKLAVEFFDASSGTFGIDTVDFSYAGNAWSAMVRPEVGVMLAHDIWVTGGVGGGYMNGGFTADFAALYPDVRLPEAMRDGWGWSWTAAARWDVEPDPMLPLGLDVRSTSLKRGRDFVRTWSIRITYRIPNGRRGAGRR